MPAQPNRTRRCLGRTFLRPLAMASLAMVVSGCNTYLGHHVLSDERGPVHEEILRTTGPTEIEIAVTHRPTPQRPVVDANIIGRYNQTVLEKTEVKRVIERKYGKYTPAQLLAPLCLLFNNPVHWVVMPIGYVVSGAADDEVKAGGDPSVAFFTGWGGQPWDFLGRLFGAHCGSSAVYDKNPPNYFIRLSQSPLIAWANPCQAMVYSPENKTIFARKETLPARVETDESTKAIAKPLAYHPVRVECAALPESVLSATTYSEGAVSVDLSPWRSRLSPHASVEVRIIASENETMKTEKLICKTDDILGPELVQAWEAKQLDGVRSASRQELDSLFPRYASALADARKKEVQILFPAEIAKWASDWEAVEAALESANPPSREWVRSRATSLLEELGRLAERTSSRKTEVRNEAAKASEAAMVAVRLASQAGAEQIAPADIAAANESIEDCRRLLENPAATAKELSDAIRLAHVARQEAAEAHRKARFGGEGTESEDETNASADSAEAVLVHRKQVALVVGIDHYATFATLRNAVSDAKAVAKVLREEYGFSDVHELYDDRATKRAVLNEVQQMVEKLTPDTDVVVFFSGHGHFNETLNRGAWVPSDAKDEADFIPNSEIYDYIRAMDNRKVGDVLVIADSCFSGSFLNIERGSRGLAVRPVHRNAHTANWLAKLRAAPSRRALSSGSNEPVPDEGGQGHSAFTRCLLEALLRPEHSTFTGTELAVRVQRLVPRNSEQTPRFGVINYAGDMAGDFVFVRSSPRNR